MSADLLRRAAEALRHRVASLPVRVQSDWETDGAEIYTAPDRNWVAESLDIEHTEAGEAVAAYVVTVQPRVALALAAVLEGLVTAIHTTVGDVAAADIFAAGLALARAILREES